uniref:Uncharacterized protein LOC113798858 n=1 Tax=Dermatophagoides pteronyssinus TaxID=6956 RepID=A0A6P6YI89_DERPT|nr:uncharacterized protein LOC113798858 [Dermatophagoides pteronyssinus]
MFRFTTKDLCKFYWVYVTIGSILLLSNLGVDAIKCYQCSTEKDGKDADNCGAYRSFNHSEHIAVDCMGEEANTPGTFCFKSIQQGPRGFIWDGRWRSVIRRCAQVSERGISWSCDWGYYENGVYWEECYCAEDQCNHAIKLTTKYHHIAFIVNIIILSYILS